LGINKVTVSKEDMTTINECLQSLEDDKRIVGFPIGPNSGFVPVGPNEFKPVGPNTDKRYVRIQQPPKM
jgi:hypothetical protein